MTAAHTRVILAAALFLAWIGWLGYLAATATRPIVLSRPQFLIATLDVIAEVKDKDKEPNPSILVREMFWSQDSPAALEGKHVTVTNLGDCDGWGGPGFYIIPLVKEGEEFRVPSIPRSPGFEPGVQRSVPRIYPETEQTRHQLKEIRKKL